jgi:hypothetical protein
LTRQRATHPRFFSFGADEFSFVVAGGRQSSTRVNKTDGFEICWNRPEPNLKTGGTVHNFKILIIIKNQKNTIILSILVKNFFFKSTIFYWLKFKLNQICENGPTWPTMHKDRISSLVDFL